LPELERLLGVDAEEKPAEPSASLRAGMTLSGVVAQQPRGRTAYACRAARWATAPLCRMEAYFWAEFLIFRSSKGTENMFPRPRSNLQPSGGEMIFRPAQRACRATTSPMARANRVDSAPTEIVVDENASDKIVVQRPWVASAAMTGA